MKAVTLEELIKNMDFALSVGDVEEIEKMDALIRSENEFRVRSRERQYDIKYTDYRIRLRQSYKLP